MLWLLPLAVTLGQPVEMALAVDPQLFENAAGLMDIWASWDSKRRRVPIRAPRALATPPPERGRVGAFFTGGVDSFFSLLRHQERSPFGPAFKIDDLVYVWGFDIPLRERAGFESAQKSFEAIAAELGKELIVVATNLRETRLRLARWAEILHGCALAGIGLALEDRFHSLVVPSTHSYASLQPWGSHPLTDPLFSTSRCRFVHDGASFTRVEKTAWLAPYDIALKFLRVCQLSHRDRNCSACGKCFRTMATLEALGVLDRCKTFDAAQFSFDRLAKVYCGDPNHLSFLSEVREFGLGKGRLDIAAAIGRAISRSSRLRRLYAVAGALETVPGIWRVGTGLKNFLDARSIL
jgi:hypothetical protein